MRKFLLLLAGLVACAGAFAAIGPSAVAAARAPGRQVPAAAAGPSGIGLAPGGPKVRSDAALYAKALKSGRWTRTPGGLVYGSCFHQVPPGAKLVPSKTSENKIILANGTVRTFAPCQYPRLVDPRKPAASATAQSPAAAGPAGVGGWMQDDWWNAPTGLGSMSVRYAVPTAPTVDGAQDFVFSSFEDSAADIVQPVVGYGFTVYNNPTNGSGTIGGYFLWEASYYAWGGDYAAGYLYKVNALDTIQGTMSASGCGSGGGGCTWTIHTKDLNSGYDSSLVIESSGKYESVQGGVLESYYANGCDTLFGNGHAVFRDLVVKDESGHQLTPAFTFEDRNQQCSMHMNFSATSADIIWTP